MDNDLISRQAAIDAIEEYADRLQMVNWKENPGVPYKVHALNWCVNTIRELPPAQPEQRWIPVSERLPKPNEEDELGFIKAYLVQDGRWMDVARWNGEFWVAWGYGIELNNVTAWMPLPEPWKGEDNDAKS